MRSLAALALCAACSSASPPAPAPAPKPADAAITTPVHHTIAAGSRHACARTHDGHVACWGELGYSASVTRGSIFFQAENPTVPVIVDGLEHVAGVEGGEDERCAWTERGEVWCWGKVGTQDEDVRAPRRIAGVADAIQVAGGALARMMCALERDGHVVCWGDPTWSDDRGERRGDQLLAPGAVRQVPEVHGALEIAVAFDHACARLAIGTVVCWEGTEPAHVVAIGAATGATSLAGFFAGANTFAALLPGGHVALWTLPQPTPFAVPDALPADATSIALGGEACVLGKAITCWRLAAAATRTIEIAGAVDLALGGSVGCARLADGTARCWGDAGLRGDGSATQAFEAVELALANVTSISIEGRSTCAAAGGKVYCWGARLAYERKGDLDFPEDASPVEVPGITDAIDVQLQYATACARLASKRVVCWGDNRGRTKSGMWLVPTDIPELAGGGPLGEDLCVAKRCLAREHRRGEPRHMQLQALPGVTRLFGGGFAREGWTCAATKTDVECLHAHYGKEGTDYWPEKGFEHHAGGREVISVPPGAGMCIRMSNGTIECDDVGSNAATVPGIDDAIALGHGPNYGVCALRATGGVACWPEELRAVQRGPGPMPIRGATDATVLASGPDHACVLEKSGTVACWGAWSLVGRGAQPASDAPSPVTGLAM